jgi:hypothetical protein
MEVERGKLLESRYDLAPRLDAAVSPDARLLPLALSLRALKGSRGPTDVGQSPAAATSDRPNTGLSVRSINDSAPSVGRCST